MLAKEAFFLVSGTAAPEGQVAVVCVPDQDGARRHVRVCKPAPHLMEVFVGEEDCVGRETHPALACISFGQLPELVRQMLDPNAPRPHAMKLGFFDKTLEAS
ncbi:MAG: hypothetical protein A3H71_02745 [Candidatus Sungbacteria bacterium RIFCSPLOWO2_02_FULL_48_13b]|uniref:Uncharacterized protein n=2 Tax=Candidatus Sungiibacteriota TaxID=1817917 RepID=A0A1G2LJ61_9BACT|nr:MAG: hypothetical protein A3C12_00965 [Candidatus Sungbacteria bacterium RIFCSPHIGHO2_02_FULL_49_20]OHA11665.1 MAG: hypothetical protein A3H71_02745 [Candidatus Sungbacteria bacterium RIFCSPLOWO2_02_FULL_48_13b]